MTPSTHIITDLTNLAKTASTAASQTKSHTEAGENQDLAGNASLCLAKAAELKVLLTTIANGTDGADPNLTTINNVLGSLV